MIRSKFAISIHILTLLAKHENQLLSSEKIAHSLNMNAALVRRELSALKQKGFLESKEGKGGGVKLSKAPEDIDISDVLDSVKTVHLLGFAKNIRLSTVLVNYPHLGLKLQTLQIHRAGLINR